ncbi:Transmembrane protein 19 [Smittium culicis]|uniref:Transmembrane protein 19 n=1 Tax=Smittium culicis TaxID=133412 RepID=A0A1R1YIM6_9FUNG|nr:Transmembrane protein 19 [Smittium culicis]
MLSAMYMYELNGVIYGDNVLEITLGQRKYMLAILFMYTAFYGCCAGDTWASELGPLSTDWPTLVFTNTEVPPGTNGGVTKLGLLASALGGALVGFFMDLGYWYQYYPLIKANHLPRIPFHFLGAVFGLTGSLIDSILGKHWQVSYYTRDSKVSCHNVGGSSHLICGKDVLSNSQVISFFYHLA